MHNVILRVLFACGRSDGPPHVEAPPPPEPTPGDPTSIPDPDCELAVDELRADPIPGQPFGRQLAVHTASEAAVAVSCTLEAAPPVWEQLVALQGSWRYVDSGVDPGPDWATSSFDDTGWAVGQAPFGKGDPFVTEIAVGALEPPPITWLRTTFDLADPAAVVELRSAVRRDDGFVMYLNGTEVLRDHVPALESIPGGDERKLFRFPVPVPAGLLVAGENVVAVELHQADGSGDAGFDLRLVASIGGEPPPEVHLVEDPTLAVDHTIPLYGLLADATYTCVAQTTGGTCQGKTATVSVVTEPSPVPLPMLALHPEHQTSTWGAYTLFNHQRPCAGDHLNRLLVVDPEGRPRWDYEIGMDYESSIDIESVLYSKDSVLWAGGQQVEGSPEIVGLDGVVRYEATYPGSELDVYHHDMEQLPDGRILGIVESDVHGVNTSGEEDTWNGFSLVEHDPATGEVTWRWDAQTAYDFGELPAAAPEDYDPYHANSVVVVNDADGEGAYVGLLDQNVLLRIDRATGHVLYAVGPGRDFQVVDGNGVSPDDEWFDHFHGANLYGDRMYVYDNAWTTDQTRAMSFRIYGANRTIEPVWSWTEYGWEEPNWGDVDELPSGAVLILMSHRICGGGGEDHPGALVEVDPATQEVKWRLDFLDDDDSTYRAQRIDGCGMFANSRYCPAIADRLKELGR